MSRHPLRLLHECLCACVASVPCVCVGQAREFVPMCVCTPRLHSCVCCSAQCVTGWSVACTKYSSDRGGMGPVSQRECNSLLGCEPEAWGPEAWGPEVWGPSAPVHPHWTLAAGCIDIGGAAVVQGQPGPEAAGSRTTRGCSCPAPGCGGGALGIAAWPRACPCSSPAGSGPDQVRTTETLESHNVAPPLAFAA